ncbi:hypothetical protein PXH69_24405 [Rhodococcus qingshengii]|uniref:Uncharacterized protein n=1 Tax=Rhodococcus qingshengii TaxID=334542 RepID=A0AAW6LUL9_RHOSG|nr:hypothetical protein [Rhodococcus qingshengii]MDE8648113.1 hypothetical protein [Rhodococcus qingshengii]
MAIIYKESTDCDGWHNGGAIAFRDNDAAFRYAAAALGEELMDGNVLHGVEDDGWTVKHEEGVKCLRIEYVSELLPSGEDWTSNPHSEVADPDVGCICENYCTGHQVSWNGRTSVKLPVKTG